jgi:GxxExxY protein
MVRLIFLGSSAMKWFWVVGFFGYGCLMETKLLEAERVHSIVGAFFKTYNYFGYGLAESVYAGALTVELTKCGHDVARELAVDIRYKGAHVAWHRLDMVVDNRVIVELKASEKLPAYAERQLMNYLRATSFSVGLLLHCGPAPAFRRYIDFPKTMRPGE